jgi:hypothetical protein
MATAALKIRTPEEAGMSVLQSPTPESVLHPAVIERVFSV